MAKLIMDDTETPMGEPSRETSAAGEATGGGARLLAEARRRAERLATLNDASRELTALRGIPDVCETIYAQTRRVLDCSVFYMGLYVAERDEVDVLLIIDQGERYPPCSLPAGASLIGEAIASRAPLVRDTVSELGSAPCLVTNSRGGPKSVMFVPMLIEDRVVGVISAQSYREHAYAGEDVQTLQSLANQAAVVIENARLYEQARGWIQQLEVVQRLGMELNRLGSVPAIAQSVARSIEALLPFDAYRVMLVDYATRTLEPLAFGASRAEYAGQNVESLRLNLGEGITGIAAQTGEPELVGNAGVHPHGLAVPGTPPIDESMLVVPMRRDQTVLGVLTLSKLGLDQYTPEHLRLLQIFADQAATAIANAQLYEAERSRATKWEELHQLRKDFVSTVTHELRTPLTSILGFTETLLSYWDRLNVDAQKDMVQKIQGSTARLHRLVQDLLVVSRVESGSLSLALTSVDLARQVEQAVLEVTALFRTQEVLLEAPEAPVTVLADAHRVQQVLVNLLHNAAKYSPEGSSITMGWAEDGDTAVAWVRDQGHGISEEQMPRLFTRFGKLSQAARAGHIGTGLGLYISRQLVEGMGGCIWLESTPGVGSTFFVRLPLAPP